MAVDNTIPCTKCGQPARKPASDELRQFANMAMARTHQRGIPELIYCDNCAVEWRAEQSRFARVEWERETGLINDYLSGRITAEQLPQDLARRYEGWVETREREKRENKSRRTSLADVR